VQCDALFLDPPWGGPEYAEAKKDSVFCEMSGRPFHELMRRVSMLRSELSRGPRYALLKLPVNFAVSHFCRVLAAAGASCTVHSNIRKMILIVVDFAPPAKAPKAESAAGTAPAG
jgi:hypothetical protein